jgi:hypothetical protein
VQFPNETVFIMPDEAKIKGPGPTAFKDMELVEAQFDIKWLDET